MKQTKSLFTLALALIVIAFSSLQCKKTVDELSKLPPITQEGKNTFGCLVNGKAWIPENGGLILTTPPLRFNYDSYTDGQFTVTTDKKISAQKINESIVFTLDSCNTAKSYFLPEDANLFRTAFNNFQVLGDCRLIYSGDISTQTTGTVKIIKFDLSQGIIAGTFEFTLSKNGCETIKITNGRFDGKL